MRRLIKLALLLLGLASLAVAIAWLIEQPGFEPVIVLLTGITELVASFALSDKPSDRTPIAQRVAQRNRRAMLDRVHGAWIEGVLEKSLYHEARIALGLEKRLDLVQRLTATERPWEQRLREQDQERTLPPDTRAIDVFDKVEGALLILGAPGAGKTTLLLELAADLLERAYDEPSHPIPVVFNLSSWAAARKPLQEWLVDELVQQYNVPRKVAQAWVQDDDILPLLDGLDEVAVEQRERCVAVLNRYRRKRGLVRLAVCSRTKEYGALAAHLHLQGAVRVQPLEKADVNDYLAKAEPKLAGVRAALQADETLYDLLDTPLMLSVAALAYEHGSAAGLQAAGTVEERRERLWTAYVEAMYARRGGTQTYTRAQMKRWLAWLAWQMRRQGQRVFLLERIQPDWLSEPEQAWGVVTGMAIKASVLFGALAFGLVFWLFAGLSGGPLGGLWGGLVLGLVGGLAGLLVGLLVGLFRSESIAYAETLYWSWPAARRGWALGLAFGIVFALAGCVVLVGEGEPASGLVFVLGLWLAIGLIAGLGSGMVTGKVTGRSVAHEAVLRSMRSALASGSIVGLAGGLVVGLFTVLYGTLEGQLVDALENGLFVALFVGLLAGLTGALVKGGFACLQHLALRRQLLRANLAPWRYVTFLDCATERLLLQRVGGGYQFVHGWLLDWFADRAEAPGVTPAPGPAGASPQAPAPDSNEARRVPPVDALGP